uniref:VWFA domain-containing protein n=1 Tax=Zooxanthella nutricula TaxID=1333877 RepID=A0A7S2NRL6_9DINO
MLASGGPPPAPATPSARPSRPAVCPFSGAVAAAGANSFCPMSRAGGGAASGDASSAGALGTASGQVAGRMLGDPVQAELDALLAEDPDLVCPITLTLLLDPVIASDGCVYERAAVVELARVRGVSPITHAALTGKVLAASEHQARVRGFMSARAQALIEFADRARRDGRAVMAMTALDRLRDYLAALGAGRDSEVVRRFAGISEKLGRAPSLGSPHERISKILREQVARAKAEGETVLQERGTASGAEKSVIFCVDTSGSMRGERIAKAQENLRRIFDQHMEDEDHMSLVKFSHCVEVCFDLQEVAADKRSDLRKKTEEATRYANGGTAFWDALVSCVGNLAVSPSGNQQWIVALTDGLDQHSRAHSMLSAQAAIRDAPGKPDLIVIGIQLQESVKPNLRALCEATERSVFIDASGALANLDDAFQQVAEMICE